MVNLTIKFNNSTVCGGEALEGEVTINVTKRIDFCAVEIYFIGEEGAKITVTTQVQSIGEEGGPSTQTTQQHIKAECFKHKELLMLRPGTPGFSSSGNQLAFLDVGTYTIPFSVSLPDTLLPTIEPVNSTPSVYITYFATAKVNTNNTFTDFWKNVTSQV